MKKGKKVVCTIIAMAMLVSSAMLSVSASTDNRSFSFGINTWGNSTTSYEVKEDTTSAWIQSAEGSYYVTVYGAMTNNGVRTDNTCGDYVSVTDLEPHYLPNWVHERGYKYCVLGLRSVNIFSGYASGYWSPDSV